MSNSVTQAVCFHHPLREAAAKCVSCGRPFCRECITPVDRRMMCAGCFKASTAAKVRPKRDWFVISLVSQVLLGLLGLWFTTYFLGRVLLEIPAPFHEGTIWDKVLH